LMLLNNIILRAINFSIPILSFGPRLCTGVRNTDS